ncbi:cyclophilin-like domain-containing protein, partial [Pyronema omphalodes]
MAQLYALEPQTNAKVLLKTNYGDLELELWGKECPLTVRNFLQLCYDGYYTNTIFHRLVPGFILQGGDPTGTGHGGDSIYPTGTFADEFHPRIRYNRRGLLGMANSGRKDDNGSQFFLTLGDTKELNNKNTLFGKIVGDTIYNLVRMSELELAENGERPLFPPKVTGAEVLVNPYDDIKPREKRKAEVMDQDTGKKKGAKKKVGKQLLSFMGDEDEDGAAPMPVKKKPKFDARLVVDAGPARSRPETPKEPAPEPIAKIEEKEQIMEDAPTPVPKKSKPAKEPIRSRSRSNSRTPPPPPSRSELLLQSTNAQIAALKKSLRRSESPPPVASTAVDKGKKKSLLALQRDMLPPTSVQGRKRRKGADDEDSFLALMKFKEKLATAAPTTTTAAAEPTELKEKGKEDGEVEEDTEASLCDLHFIPNCQSCSKWDLQEEDEGDGAVTEDLWSHTLSFEKDRLGKDLTWKKKNEELVVIDPREKSKEI